MRGFFARIIKGAVAARETFLLVHLTPFETQLAIALAVLAVVLVLHLALDLFVLRRLRRRRQAAIHERHLAAAAELSLALSRAGNEQEAGRVLLDTLNELTGNDFSSLVLADESGAEGRGVVARARVEGSGAVDVDWYPSLRVDLRHEVSGIRRVFETHAPLVVEEALSSPEMNPDLIERTGLKSLFLLPLEGEEIFGVIASGSTTARRFTQEQLTLAKTLVAEGSLAFERARASAALERALERERLVSEISRRARSEADVDRLMEISLAETGTALRADRCFLRLGEPTSAVPLRAEWRREGMEPIPATATPFLSVSNLALRELRTVAVADVEEAEELIDESLGGRAALRGIGSRAVLATPIILFGSAIGGLAAHTTAVRRWSEDDVKFIEAIAREYAIALNTAGLLEENQRRLEQQQELLAATEAMAAELELDSILSRRLAGGRAALVGALSAEEVMSETSRQATALLDADASLLLQLRGGELIVSAAAGESVEQLIGRHFPVAISLAGDVVNSRRALVAGELPWDSQSPQPLDPVVLPEFQALMGVPIIGISDTLEGVLLVYARNARVWREKETDSLVSLAASTAAALANANLYLRVSLEREQSVAILSSVADGIVAVDRRGRIVLWNAAAERITGISSNDALGRTTLDVLRQDLGSPGNDSGERAVAIKRGGRELWLMVTESIMRDPADQIAGRIYALRDVSNDRLIEQAKSVFVSSVSHELRAPLTSIYGFAETLLRRGELFDETHRRTFLSYIASESERLTGIVDALLDVAELDAGDLEVDLAETDVARVVREVVESARLGESGSASGDGHQFVIDLPDDQLRAEVDRDKLRRVLGNLIDNAIKFSPAGGKVTVAGRRKSGIVELRVEDEGFGVRPEEREHIFRKFYRGYSSTLSGGTGLGLFITRGLINAMGGRIWVDSEEGRGSSFVLELVGAGNGEGKE